MEEGPTFPLTLLDPTLTTKPLYLLHVLSHHRTDIRYNALRDTVTGIAV